MPLNLGTNWELTSNGIKNLARNNGAELTKIKVKSGQNIKLGIQFLSNLSTESTFSAYIDNQESKDLSIVGFQSYKLNKIYQKNYTAKKDCEIKIRLWGNANSEIFEFQLWAEVDNLTEYKIHQEQVAIMPVQQELLENDYIADVEHHEWKKLILTGKETGWNRNTFGNGKSQYYIRVETEGQNEGMCSHFKFTTGTSNNIYYNVNEKFLVFPYPTYNNKEIDTIDKWKSFLQSQYEAGTPVTIYYKLATPIDLELTEEQKAVREQKLNTYKNITNTNLSDELASIDVEYKKDQDTINKNYENRLAALESALIS